MQLIHIMLHNWKNFKQLDIPINNRLFVIGANASGKSNFLDALRFMRDIVKPGGGLQFAVLQRGGVSKIRCLSARQNPDIQLTFKFKDEINNDNIWEYNLSFEQEPRGNRNTLVKKEIVTKNSDILLERPNNLDKGDKELLTQTALEQITANKDFREIARFFEAIHYLHLVPQLLKYPDAFSGQDLPEDPFGKGFLQKIAKTPEKIRTAWLNKIQKSLQVAVPQLKNLVYTEDIGHPHLEVTYEHWRPNGAKQNETQLSDGTLRLIGLLWSLLDGTGLLLLEEPELSLHEYIVKNLVAMLYSAQRIKRRQIIVTTHSTDLLSNKSISLSEILLLQSGTNGTEARLANSFKEMEILVANGLTPAEITLPYTTPKEPIQGFLFE